ncbi:MAG: UDP-N-acetylglucosamine 2-epimerase (non-hydrolyzing) [Myxococcota bacterium]|nr:UDP-N-acetylglucosamine 2-epimerase (non-hydrolyzing) [Myxococcota bacterium]
MSKVALVMGTRPEAIKLAPLVKKLEQAEDLKGIVCSTGQHKQMLEQVFKIFDIEPDFDLGLMQQNQTLTGLTSRALTTLSQLFQEEKPDIVVVQGDTTTAFTGALAAFYHKIPVAHVEAGLRTHNLHSPWPEEGNRSLIGRLAQLHFAPTQWSANNLRQENIADKDIIVTGNTVIDALLYVQEKLQSQELTIDGIPSEVLKGNEQLVLITGHRRESFGDGFKDICNAIVKLSERHPDTHFVYPVHLNPNVRKPVFDILGNTANQNIHLINPLEYEPFVMMMQRSTLLLTDSGGVQEEGPSLGKPVLVMRETTERPEGVEAGTVKLVGTDFNNIVETTTQLLEDRDAYEAMAKVKNPYGDGKASDRIVAEIRSYLNPTSKNTKN